MEACANAEERNAELRSKHARAFFMWNLLSSADHFGVVYSELAAREGLD
jgi:hypothetical protein